MCPLQMLSEGWVCSDFHQSKVGQSLIINVDKTLSIYILAVWLFLLWPVWLVACVVCLQGRDVRTRWQMLACCTSVVNAFLVKNLVYSVVLCEFIFVLDITPLHVSEDQHNLFAGICPRIRF